MRDPVEVLRTVWGYEGFRPMQENVVRDVLAGKDTLALMPTGGGKSLCFQVPALALGKLCLVVSPLIALMKDQVQRLRSLGITATALTSGMYAREIDIAIDNAAVGRMSFLYVSPERLASDMLVARLHRLPLSLIAVDEAHCISQWGFDFRPAYRNIAQVRQHHPNVPVLALTASATRPVALDIMEQLAFRAPNELRSSFSRPELTLWISEGEDKMGRLLRIAENVPGSGIVYLRERKGTARIAQFLQQQGISAQAYHAGMTFEERDRVQQEWSSGRTRFVCATNAFGMGIDKGDVRSVIHLEPPPDLESYYQEAGRGGRDGKPAYSFLLTHASDRDKLMENVRRSLPTLTDVRRVYQAFADQHGIALGSGMLGSYDLDLRELARRTTLPASTVNHALKALELDARIALSEGARTPSRLMMRMDHRALYDLRVRDNRHGPVIEALLRMYGGLFEEAAIIDETRLSQELKISTDQVIELLRALERQNVLFYKPRNDAPQVTLLLPRADAQRLVLNKEALQAREERAMERAHAMVRFVFDGSVCRERALLAYFDEAVPHDCGRCDACRARARTADRSTNIALAPSELDALRWMRDVTGSRTPEP